jgi:hypothetical protein
LIPRSVEVLGPFSFAWCQSLSCISFELDWKMTKIKAEAFRESGLESLMIPRSLRFINKYSFSYVKLSLYLIRDGNDRFVFQQDFLMDVIDQKLIRNFSSSSNIEIPSSIEVLGQLSFGQSYSFSSISFESPSHLIRIECNAFSESSLE